ncbi:dienelactone hydrolase family protein [Hydrogenophaga sp. 5NK40-0174]
MFLGQAMHQDAPVQAGRWPLVLVSHGVGGHWRSLTWLEAGLAQHGAMVLGINHPGSTHGDYDMRRSLDHGSRVRDLQAAMDAVLADPELSAHIDTSRIYVVGFSLGGWSALSIGGLRGDLNAYTQYCAASGHRHCKDIARADVDLAQLDAAQWNRSYRDPRVKAVAAIDPALHQGLETSHARDMVSSVLLIGLGAGADRLPDTDFSPGHSTLTSILPKAKVETLAPAMHFSALGICSPQGAKLLAEEGDDAVCTDPAGTDRPALHRRIVALIANEWGLQKPAVPAGVADR